MSHLPFASTDRDASLDAERCIVELQRGREILLGSESEYCAVRLVETADASVLNQITKMGDCQLVVSQTRARVLGYECAEATAIIDLPSPLTWSDIASLAGLEPSSSDVTRTIQWQPTPQPAAVAALHLIKQAAVLPALLIYPQPVQARGILSLSLSAANQYQAKSGALIELSGAHVPLATAISSRLRVFRERHGNAEHVAIIVGEPDWSEAVSVRLHSSCFTGDILGSLKCDCGEQLQGAIAGMARTGGGVVLYVSQEGRGIGLASKLRAYQLQAEGLDTIEANQHLGFASDARRYHAAAAILQAMNIDRIKLITNNPDKIEALRAEGIDVIERLPSVATVNAHNARYLETKRVRAGHLSMESVG